MTCAQELLRLLWGGGAKVECYGTEERCQKGKEDLSQASFKYTHFAVAGKSSYEDERRSLHHHHMMISDAEGLMKVTAQQDVKSNYR